MIVLSIILIVLCWVVQLSKVGASGVRSLIERTIWEGKKIFCPEMAVKNYSNCFFDDHIDRISLAAGSYGSSISWRWRYLPSQVRTGAPHADSASFTATGGRHSVWLRAVKWSSRLCCRLARLIWPGVRRWNAQSDRIKMLKRIIILAKRGFCSGVLSAVFCESVSN